MPVDHCMLWISTARDARRHAFDRNGAMITLHRYLDDLIIVPVQRGYEQ